MRLRSCPKIESLFELVSIPDEVNFFEKLRLKAHLLRCADCQRNATTLRTNWEYCFSPEPEITGSLMKVYARLQKDETLILKGWKLSPNRPTHRPSTLLKEGWVVRGTFAAGIVAAIFFTPWSKLVENKADKAPDLAIHNHATSISPKPPFAQFRVEEKNSIRVHYVEPELLQSVEFETTSGR